MANRQHWPVQASTNEVKHVYGSFVGKATAAPTVVSGDVVSLTRSGVGALVITMAHKYSSLLLPAIVCVGPTALEAKISAIDVVAKTVTIQLQIEDGTATDATTGDTVYVNLQVKNSGV